MDAYYSDELVTLFHGDMREVLATLGDGTVDMIFTDPPYGHNNNDGDLASHREAALGKLKPGEAIPETRPILNDGFDEANGLVRHLFAESKRLLVPGGCCCCCCCGGGGTDPQFARWSLWMDELLGFKQMVIWDKGGLGMGWHYRRSYETVLVGEKKGAACKWYGGATQSNVVRVPKILPSATDHPTPKPIPLPSLFIRLHSQPGDLVLDPFAGGGSTLLAAKLEGRKAIGVELDERWCALAAARLAQGTLAL